MSLTPRDTIVATLATIDEAGTTLAGQGTAE
jgi:hypothetical protein